MTPSEGGEEAMWRVIENDWWYTLSNLPFLLLQGVAIIGVFCIILVFGRKEHDVRPYRFNPGIALGVTGFVLTWLISESSPETMRLYMRIDLMFLGGLLGGIRGGIACWLLMACGVLLFDGGPKAHAPVLDMALIALVGIGLNRWLRGRLIERLTWSDIGIILAARFLTSIITPFIICALGIITAQVAASVVSKRLAAVGVSLLVLMGILSVLKWDIHQRKARMRQYLANRTDQLTGLPNRLALHEHLQDLTRKAGTGAHTLILVEVANLGDLIALHGHLWGESFWKTLEQVLKRLFESTLLVKYQPCLFLFSDALLAITLHGASVAEVQRLDLLPALRDELDRSLRERTANDSLLPRLNYGVAELQSGSVVSVEMAMRNLSLALHSDDQPIGYFAPSLVKRVAQDERIRRLLTEWIDNRTPPLHYQPKIELATGRTLGAEALLRACDEDGERISPQRVLKVATQQQLLLEFEWSTIEAVVRDLRRCKDSAAGLLSLSVNVSSVSLLDPEFASRVIYLLRSASVDSESLSLEVTEAIPVPELDSVCDNMMVLRKAGVRLSLDDFGTGYSALALLAQFPFNEVKIDHSMISRLDQPRMRVAVSLALGSAQRYSANLVAEGVETQQQLETLIQLGVRCGQGYLFSAAVPLSQLVF